MSNKTIKYYHRFAHIVYYNVKKRGWKLCVVDTSQSTKKVDAHRTLVVMSPGTSSSGISGVTVAEAPYNSSSRKLCVSGKSYAAIFVCLFFLTVMSKSCGSQEVKFLENSSTV